MKRGEKPALPKADASMEVPGTPREPLHVYDQKMLRTVGDGSQLDVAPQAVTLTGNADLGEWKADPGRCPLPNGRPFGIIAFHGQTFVNMWRRGLRPILRAGKRDGGVYAHLPPDHRHIEGWMTVGGEYGHSREDEYCKGWFKAESEKEARRRARREAPRQRPEQREASIDGRLRVCRDCCEVEGMEVVAECRGCAPSGETGHRPGFRRMIANAPGSGCVAAYMFDRFSRDRCDSATCRKMPRECGARALGASEKVEGTPEGGLQGGMPELLSECYARDLARRVRGGMEGNALRAGDDGYRIFGYPTDPETRCYVVNEAEANAVREMLSMHIAGNSVDSIAREMASRGWATATGEPVDCNRAWRVPDRRACTGLYPWGGIEVPGGMPQVIDEVTFARSQAVVPRRRRKDENWDVYRLTGRLFCGLCGKPMHGTAGTGRRGKRYRYCACREGDGCKRPWVRGELVEDSMAEAAPETCPDERRMRMLARRIVDAYVEPGEEEAEMASTGCSQARCARSPRMASRAT